MQPGPTSCEACGAQTPPDARYCPSCGSAIAPREGARRLVTILLSDVVDSTALAERVDAETFGAVMTRFYGAMREGLARHGGTVEKFIGDAVVGTFGLPRVHEDDALRAVRAALDMRRELDALNDQLARAYGVRLEIRTGISSGEVLVGGGPAVLGSPANLAARLQTAAGIGEILLGPATTRLVRDVVEVEPAGRLDLKGFPEPVEAFRLLSLATDGVRRARARSPLVGRDEELALLELAFRRAERSRAAQLVTVLGDAGIGKTRLVEELVAAVEGSARTLWGRCLPYGDGITFFPVAEVVSAAASLEAAEPAERARGKIAALLAHLAQDDTTARVVDGVAGAIGLGDGDAAREETLWAVRRFFEGLAVELPLILVFDDLQWAEPTFLDLLSQIAERTRDVPILVAAMARPELRDLRPAWGGGAANSVTVSLVPLTIDESVRIVERTLGGGAIDEALAARIAEVAGGNPLFLEEYVAMLVDEGIVGRRGERWRLTRDLSLAPTPPTLTGLLAARLERLGQDERDVLTHASVIGKAFSLDHLTVLLPEAPHVDRTVAGLTERGVLRRLPGSGAGQLEFAHQLLRDAAYESTPKTRRADLHERFAERLETEMRDRPEELDAIIGYHLARAHAYRLELGPADEHTRELAAGAADRLSVAGRRALERGDPPAATRLLRRAVELAPEPGPRADARLRLSEALRDGGEYEAARASLEAGRDDADAAGDRALQARCEHGLAVRAFVADPAGFGLERMRETMQRLLATFRSMDDDEGLAECLYQLATIAWVEGHAVEFGRYAREGLTHAQSCGNPRLMGRALSYVASSLSRGPLPLDDAVEELRALRGRLALSLAEEALVGFDEAEMLAGLGRFDEAHGLMRVGGGVLDDLAHPLALGTADSSKGVVARLEGDLAEAEACLRRSFEFFDRSGDALNAGIVAVDLAGVLNDLGNHDGSLAATVTAERLAAPFDAEPQIGWRTERARALGALGRHDEALAAITDAATRVDATDVVPLRATTEAAAGDVHAAAGRIEDAVLHWRAARDIWTAKRLLVGARRAEARLTELADAQSP